MFTTLQRSSLKCASTFKRFLSSTAFPLQKLYVGNLTWTQTEDSLRTLFSKHGEITDLFLVRDRLTGKSRGFAFIEFADATQAEAAKTALNGFQHDGRPLRINEATEKQPQSQAAGGSRF